MQHLIPLPQQLSRLKDLTLAVVLFGLRASYIGSRSRGMNYSLNINKPEPSLISFSPERRVGELYLGIEDWRAEKHGERRLQMKLRLEW